MAAAPVDIFDQAAGMAPGQHPANTSPSGGDIFDQAAAQPADVHSANQPTDIAHQPASFSGVLQTLGTKEGLQAAADPIIGFVKGIGDTVHGTGELIRKGGNAVHAGLGDKIVPPVGQQALDNVSTDTNNTQHVGKALEMIAEGMTGEGALDEAGKVLSFGDKMKKLGTIASFMEKHPIIAKMIVGGAKGAAIGGAQGTVKTGDLKTGAEAAAGGAVVGGALSAVGQGAKYVRDLYKPLARNTSLADVQPVLQKGIRDVLSDTAQQSGVKGAASSSVRDVVADTAEGVKAKSQPVFQAVDDFSNKKFSNAQAQAKKYSGAIDKAGKDAFEAALQKQDQLFDKYIKSPNAKFSAGDLEQAKADWRQFRAMQEVDDAVKAATGGQRPEIAAGAGKQPAENVNPKLLLNRLNRLYNDGTLETALGKDGAHQLLQHAGSAQTTAEDIAYNIRQSNAKQVAGRKVVKGAAAVGIGAGIGAAASQGVRESVKNALSGQ